MPSSFTVRSEQFERRTQDCEYHAKGSLRSFRWVEVWDSRIKFIWELRDSDHQLHKVPKMDPNPALDG
jgi:hypothetical protein